jgi:hypothetical protein
VTTERAVLGGKRVLSCYVLLLPTGGEPIKLEYLDKVQAVGAGAPLLTSPGNQAIHVANQSMKSEDGDEV